MTQQLPVTIDHSTPVPQRFGREAQVAFLHALAQWGNVRAAAGCAGVSRSTAYRMRRACGRFRELWDTALVLARPQVEEVLADRALNGVEETVFYHGEEVATRTRYDSRLLLAHLARLDNLAKVVRDGVYDFEYRLMDLIDAPEKELAISALGEPELGPDRG
ncbi:MAG: hypothetical protein AAF697_02495 [Pseudomonadota bacterium]